MFSTTTIITLSITLLAPLAHSIPFLSSLQAIQKRAQATYKDVNGAASPGPNVWCSADTSDATVVPFAQDPGWHSSMSACMGELAASIDSWNGTECVPKDSNGAPLGPTFGFWKNCAYHDSPYAWCGTYPQSCYTNCAPCLQRGIDKLLAVTTRCTFKVYPYGKDGGRYGCDMGFDHGT